MLNNIFVPNTLICDEPGGTINWNKITPYIEANFTYDEKLIDENEFLQQLHAPYKKCAVGKYPLELHEYFYNIATGKYPNESGIDVGNNAIVLRYTYTSVNNLNDYVVLNRSQGYFCYDPNLDPATDEKQFFSEYDPLLVPCYIRPKGEMAQVLSKDADNNYVADRLIGYGTVIKLTNPSIYYTFRDKTNTYKICRPAWFDSDNLYALLFLNYTDKEPFARVPAEIVNEIVNDTNAVALHLKTDMVLPSKFYIEVI